ncbi:coilin-like [Centruroides sculpturatus]|uniref:coilin-like n=1 Tax=Centruroides sculpturatus TaxID=218467 RepID=UPI000C6CBDD5|nr:coilin-like [Centruroides sculpturatus]
MAVPTIVRIKLDLKEVSHAVSNTLIWIAVDTNILRTIQDLKDLVAKRFNIKEFNLFFKDCLLPDDETISIVRDEDLIKIQLNNSSSCILENNKTENCFVSVDCKNISKTVRKRKISDLSDDSDKLQSKTDVKNNEDNIETFRDKSVTCKKKKKRKKEKYENKYDETVVTPECEINVNGISSLFSEGDKQEELILKSKELELVSDKCKTNDDEEFDKEATLQIVHNTFEECNQSSACDDTRISKVSKKRRRYRKKKKDNFLDNSMQNTTDESNKISKIDEQPLIVKVLNVYKNKHTRFDENEGKNDNFTNALLHEEKMKKFTEKIQDSVSFEEEVLQIMHNTPLNEQRNKKSSQSKSLSQNHSSFQNSSNTENNFNEKKSNLFAQLKNKEKQLEISASSSFTNEDEQQNLNEVITTEEKDYQKYPILRGPPRVGDIVAFKVLELSSSYCPEISSYKEGKILQHNQGTDNFVIEMFTPNVTRT